MPTGIAWKPQTIEELKRLYQLGLPCSQIGARIGVSRNAVLGKVHRLGLPLRGNRISHGPRRVKKADRQPSAPIAPRPHYGGSITQKVVFAKAVREAGALPIEPPPRRKGKRPTLLQLKPHQCRWPFGDPRHPDHHYCGETVPRDGSSYCEEHRAIAYVSGRSFLAHIGPRPSSKHSVDRIDNDRGYEPGNVRWATASQQVANRRRLHGVIS